MEDHRFLKACRGEAVDRTPVWFMRQAGRCLPEYRSLREQHGLRDLCLRADLTVEATLQPMRRFDVDAAILFSDIRLPLEPMGIRVHWPESEDEVQVECLRSVEEIRQLRSFDPAEDFEPILTAIGALREELTHHRPLLGWSGAPFTLAVYALDGDGSDNLMRTRSLMYSEPDAWHLLCRQLTDNVVSFLRAQVEAGAEAIQLFDSFAGLLSPADYRHFALPYSRMVLDSLRDLLVPSIHYAGSAGEILEAVADAGGDVIAIDWRVPLDEAWERIGSSRAIQGNLDPSLLLSTTDRLLAGASDVLERAAGRPGHIFNLGHGLFPSTPLDRIQSLTRYVHSYSGSYR